MVHLQREGLVLTFILCMGVCVFASDSTITFEKSSQRYERSTTQESHEVKVNERQKRETDNSNTCATPEDYVSKLNNMRDSHFFRNDLNPSISLTWSGTDGVIIALTTMTGGIAIQPSKLYRSINRGKAFSDISSQLNNDYIRKSYGMQVSPVDSTMIILVGYDSPFSFLAQNTRLYITDDAGANFQKHTCPFQMDAATLKFHPKDKFKLLAKSQSDGVHALWLSTDFGHTWKKIQDYVPAMHWDPVNSDLLYFTFDPQHALKANSIENELYRHSISSEKSTLLAQHVHSFAVQNDFIFLSIQFTGKNTSRVMHVSKNEGHAWNAAQLPLINPEQFYSILDMTEDMVFVHVDKPLDTGYGDIYTSDERGIVYSLSLSKHLYPNTGGITDFYKVMSLNGVYITSQLGDENTVHSLISFNKGGTWQSITRPDGTNCPTTEKVCNLQIHNFFSASKHVRLPSFPLSSASTVGIILAHGNLGDGLSFSPPDVYVSVDGGYTWNQPSQLKGPHFYGIGDAGGILYAVESTSDPTNQLKFSLDEGECWHTYNFSDTPIQVTGVSAEPGEKAADVSIWGWDVHGDKSWVAMTVSFDSILGQPCGRDDYVVWTAHASNKIGSIPDVDCQLGKVTTHTRRKKGTVCRNGDQLDPTATTKACACTTTDFLCDYGFKREEHGNCVEDPNAQSSNRDICIDDEEEVIVTHGYRKIPGDGCVGNEPKETIKLLKKSCAKANISKNDFGVDKDHFEVYTTPLIPVAFQTDINKNDYGVDKNDFQVYTHPTPKAPSTWVIVLLVIAVLTLGSMLVYVLYRKRDSLLRIRYTPLSQDNDEAPRQNGLLAGTQSVIDDDDAVIVDVTANGERDTPRNGAILSYHDDSDEDLLVT
ncbi:sortilin-like isoform X1 [Clavelina lepadiformis]|uniref:sortilin-like isoform X1 n=1 Tax=Clavelina lepadiformis TaxID=159417 RepID=UPI004042BB39